MRRVTLKLYDRWRIALGAAADPVVFDADRVRDRSTLAEPSLAAERFIHVVVDGRFVVEQGKTTKALPGRVLRRPGSPGPPRPARAAPGVLPPAQRRKLRCS
jgi:N-acyl-D-amino-acid deacylase